LKDRKFDGEFISLENFVNNRVEQLTLDIKRFKLFNKSKSCFKAKIIHFFGLINMSKKFMKGGHTIP